MNLTIHLHTYIHLFIDPTIVLSMFILSYIFCDNMGSSGVETNLQVLFCLFIYVLPFEIQLSIGEGLNPINPFNPTTLLCLFQDRTWIYNVTWSFFCVLILFVCLFVYICIAVGNSVIKRVGISSTGLNPPHLCACPKPEPN